jgi:hypothetical protein
MAEERLEMAGSGWSASSWLAVFSLELGSEIGKIRLVVERQEIGSSKQHRRLA